MPPKRYQTRRALKVETQDTNPAAETAPEDDTTTVTEKNPEVADDMKTEESSESATQELVEAVSPSKEVATSKANGSSISKEDKQDQGPEPLTETQEIKADLDSNSEMKESGDDVERTAVSTSDVTTKKETPEQDDSECVMKTDDTAEEILIDLSTEELEGLDDSKDQAANTDGSSTPKMSTAEPTKVTPSKPSGSQPEVSTKQVGSKSTNENVKISASQKISIAKQYCKDHGIKWTVISKMQGLMRSLLMKGYFKPGANIEELEANEKRISAQKEEAAKQTNAIQNKPNVVQNKSNATNRQIKPPKKGKPGERVNGNSNKASNETSAPYFNSKEKVKICDRLVSYIGISYEQLGNDGLRYLSQELDSKGFFTKLAGKCGKGHMPSHRMIYVFSKRRIYSNVLQNVLQSVTGGNQVLSEPVRGPKRLAGTSGDGDLSQGEFTDLLAPIKQLLQHQQSQMKRNFTNFVTGSASTASSQRPTALPNERVKTIWPGVSGPAPLPQGGPPKSNRRDVNPRTSASNPLVRNPFLRPERRVEPKNSPFHQERGFNQVLSSKPKFGESCRQQDSHIEPYPPGGSVAFTPFHPLSAQSKLVSYPARKRGFNQRRSSKPQFGESSRQLERDSESFPVPTFGEFQQERGEDQWTNQKPNKTEESYNRPSSFGRRGLSPPSDDDDGYESYLKGERVIVEHSNLHNFNASQSSEIGRDPWQMPRQQLERPSSDNRRLGNVEPKEQSQPRTSLVGILNHQIEMRDRGSKSVVARYHESKAMDAPCGDDDWRFKRDPLPSRNVGSKFDNSPWGNNDRFENKPSTSTGNLRLNARRNYEPSEIFGKPTSAIGKMSSSFRPPSPKRFRRTPVVERVPIVPPGKTCSVAVVPLEYPRHHLSSREMDLIRNALLESMSSSNGPRFNGTTEERGAVVFDCEDQYTVAWLWETVPTLRPWPGAQLRATSWRDDRAEVAVEVPKALANLSEKALCEKLIAQNPRLNAKNWEFRDYDQIRKIAFFAVDAESLEELTNSNFSLYLGFSKVSCTKVKDTMGH